MSINLTDDLREAIGAAGTPLKLVDPATGETYFVVPEATFERAQVLLADEEALQRAQIPNARLLDIAKRNRPPAEWYKGDEEDLFQP
jgi:hypothetical protein